MGRRDAVWAAWLAGSLGSFAVLEFLAYRREIFPTLSATLARWLGTHPPTTRGKVGLALFAAAWLVLTAHIGRYRPPDVTARTAVRSKGDPT